MTSRGGRTRPFLLHAAAFAAAAWAEEVMGDFRSKAVRVVRSRGFLCAVLCAAFLLRAGRAFSAGDAQRFWDSDSYITIADNLIAGKGFVWGDQVAGRPPLYPLLVAAAGVRLPGGRFLALYLVQAVLGTLAVLLFHLSTRRLLGEAAAGIAALILAVYPFHIFYVGTVLSETLFIFLLSAVFFLLVKTIEDGSLAAAAGCGLACGAAHLTRPSVLGLVVIFAALAAWRVRGAARGLASAALIAGVAFLAVLPWGIRNKALTGHFIISTSGVGASLYDALGPQADGSSDMSFLNTMSELEGMGEVERDRYLREKALEAAADSPFRVVRLAAVKAYRFWAPVPNSPSFRSPLYLAVSLLAVTPVYILALGALAAGLVKPAKLLTIAAAPLYFTLLHMVFVGSTRYRAPVMPFVIMAAARFAARCLRVRGAGGGCDE